MKKISKFDAERKSLQKQLEDIYRNKGKYTSAATTGDLFGQDLVEDDIDRIANKIGSKKNLTEQQKEKRIAIQVVHHRDNRSSKTRKRRHRKLKGIPRKNFIHINRN